jgi:hypothetical protein
MYYYPDFFLGYLKIPLGEKWVSEESMGQKPRLKEQQQ